MRVEAHTGSVRNENGRPQHLRRQDVPVVAVAPLQPTLTMKTSRQEAVPMLQRNAHEEQSEKRLSSRTPPGPRVRTTRMRMMIVSWWVSPAPLQGFEFESTFLLSAAMFTMAGALPVLTGPCQLLWWRHIDKQDGAIDM